MKKIIIDGEGAVFGRLCSYVAKKALEGNEVIVVNSDKVVITGNKIVAIEKYRDLRTKGGSAQKGPYHTKIAYQIVKRGIRGMLPDYRKGIGSEAFSKIKCHNGIPSEFKDQKMIKAGKDKRSKYIELNELVSKL